MQKLSKISDVKPFQKSQDSIFSTLFTRRLSRVLTFLLLKIRPGISPNTVSVISFVIALVAVVLFLHDEYWWRFGGAVLLQLSFGFDCSDGEVARITNQQSAFGAWFDSVLDRFKEVLMVGALTWAWYDRVDHDPWVLVLGFTAIVGMQLVSYVREAKKASWPSTRSSELFITKNIYIGTVDVTIYLVTLAVVLQLELWAMWIFAIVSVPLLAKQLLSAYKAGKK